MTLTRSTPPLLKELNRTIKHAWARRVLAYYDHRQQELLHLAVNCMRLIQADTLPDCLKLCVQMLTGLAHIDCGFVHFAREWFRVHEVDVPTATARLRRDLLAQLYCGLSPDCQAIAKSWRTDPATALPRATKDHRCWSIGGHDKPGHAAAIRRARTKQAPKSAQRGSTATTNHPGGCNH